MSGSERGFPRSLIEFQGRFATESACAQYLFERRWPEGFVCPGCGGGQAWLLNTIGARITPAPYRVLIRKAAQGAFCVGGVAM